MEKAAYYEELLKKSDHDGRKDGAMLQDGLSKEYYVMRIALVLTLVHQPSAALLTKP